MKQQKFIQIQNEIPMTHCFIYIKTRNIQQDKIIPLVDKEFEESLNFSEESILSFIKYVHREQIPLNDDNVFALHYLGTKYEINSLIQSTKDYIKQNETGLILQILTNFQFDQNFDKQQYEDILSDNLINYISDNRLLLLEFPIIYRVIEKTPHKSDTKIVDFCFKCLDKYGRKASPLFSMIDLCEFSNEKINLLMTKYSKVFDFHFINSSLLKSLYQSQNDFYLNEKNNEAEHEKILLFINEIKENQSKIMNEQKQLEDQILNQIKQDMNQLKIDHQKEINKMKEDTNQLKIDHQKEINQMKDELNLIKLQLEQKSKEIKSIENIKSDINNVKSQIQGLQSIQSQIKEEKCYLFLRNYTDINKFNSMDGELQLYISIINLSFLKNQPMIRKIHEFLLYLSNVVFKYKNQPKSKFNYIFIPYNETATDKSIDFSSIGISWKIIEILYDNKILNSSEFQNQISNFNSIYFEIGYPSNIYDFIYYNILRIKKSDKSKYKISIFIHGVKETDFIFSNNQNIDCIRLDSTVNSIIGDNDNGSFKSCSSLTEILIPSSVTSIGNHSFYYCCSLVQISIPSSVTSIGDYAFSSCSSLTEISLPSSVISIGNYAFSSCSSLIKISMPSSLTSFGGNVFCNCKKLEKIVIIPFNQKRIEYLEDKLLVFKTNPKSEIFDALLWANPNINKIIIPSFIKIIYDGVFRNNLSLTQISIPSSVISIGNYAFGCCNSLTQVSLPQSLSEIGEFAFGYCEKLGNISIPSSITSIKKGTFDGCRSMTQISIPSSVHSIGDNVFQNCCNLLKLSFETPSSVKSIGKNAFNYCTKLIEITIPSSVTSIEENAFQCCYKLVKLAFEIPSSLTYIGQNAFGSCKELTQISIPSSIVSFGRNVFAYCENLNKVSILSNNEKRIEYFEDKFLIYKANSNNTYDTLLWVNPKISTTAIPSFIKIIGEGAYEGFKSLTQIIIPSSVTSIGNFAFFNCSSLTQITFSSSVTSIGNHAFQYCSSLTQISFPSSLTSIGDYAFGECKLLERISIPSSMTSFGSFVFINCRKINKIEILSCNEKRIEYFENKFLILKANAENSTYDTLLWVNPNISTATVPSFIKIIHKGAFYESKSLTQVNIPFSVTSIGDFAFADCNSLAQITIPSSVISKGDIAFRRCKSLKQISIPSSVTSIGENAFINCDSLTEITIPSSLLHSKLKIPSNANITVI